MCGWILEKEYSGDASKSRSYARQCDMPYQQQRTGNRIVQGIGISNGKAGLEAAVEAYLNDTYEMKEVEAEGQKYLISENYLYLAG